MPAFRTLDDVNLSGKRVLCRVDLNVPIADGKVTDATRIERVVPTLREIMNKGGALIVLAHFDRPKGKVVPEMSLRPVAAALEQHLGRPVKFVFTDWQSAPQVDVKPGECVLMENTRYHAGEEKNDEGFSKMLASLGDIYVNDAFSAAHRAHSSTEGIAHFIPAYAGRAMEAELKALQLALETPKRPVIAIVGGAKVSTKLDLLGNLVKKVDALVIGGAMANTFLLAQGHAVGKSLAERDLVDTARRILQQAEDAKCAIILPVDGIVAKEFKAGAESHDYGVDAIPGRRHDPRRGPALRRPRARGDRRCAYAGVERAARRLRDRALRPGDGCRGEARGGAHQGRQARLRGGRRRHGGSPQPRGRCPGLHLHFNGGRRLPRMARGQAAARRQGIWR